jgi:DNA modification methylase
MKIDCSYKTLVPIDQLVPHPSNANIHGEKQIEMLAKIMNYQGWRHPIVVSSLSGFIVAGHGRLAAAKKLGWTECPVDTQNFEDKIQETAFLYSDNKIAELAEHDDELMKLTALELNLDQGFDLDLLGIPDLDLSMPDPDKEATQDDVPEVTQSISKLGDIYELGQHRLMCGDSISIDAVEKLMNGEKADMVFTDPPYGMFLDTDFTSMDGLKPDGTRFNQSAKGGKVHRQIAGDNEDFNPSLIKSVFDNFGYCKEVFLWGADYYAEFIDKKNDGAWIVWDKRSNEASSDEQAASADKAIGSSFELCWSKAKHKREIARIRSGIFGAKNEQGNNKTVHPTQKPIQLVQWFIDKWGINSQLIIDLFGGSGSTLIACEKTKRRCFMMELDPHYVDVIVARWCKYTGKKEIKRNNEPMEWTI